MTPSLSARGRAAPALEITPISKIGTCLVTSHVLFPLSAFFISAFPSTPQPLNPSTPQPLNPSTTQPLNRPTPKPPNPLGAPPMSAFFHIARNTFRETLRQPIFFLVLGTALALIGIFPIFTLFVFREQVKLVVDSALATSLLFGWGAAALAASHAISREIRTGTALLVLSKPVERGTFLAAKMAGVLAALVLFMFLTSLATLVAVRVARDQFQLDNRALGLYFATLAVGCAVGGVVNFSRRSSFPMAAVLGWLVLLPVTALGVALLSPGGGDVPTGYEWELLPALLLITLAALAMGALATALSTRLDLVPNVVLCTAIFLLGLMSDYLFGRHAGGSLLAAMLYAVIPNWQLYWMADALAAHKPIPWDYVAWAAGYTVQFIALFGLLAATLFHNREVGRQCLV